MIAGDAAIGTRVGEYTLLERIGSGGFASVFRAVGPQDEVVALKVLSEEFVADVDAVARVERELSVLRDIAHPCIVSARSAVLRTAPFPHFAMELLIGESLADRLERGPLAPALAIQLTRQVADALDAAHTRGVIHRDLKASNVFLCEGTDLPKLLDFGIAKDLQADELTRSRQIIGSPTAMAPEQITGGPVSPRTDVYALGALLFHMLTGTPPFSGESATLLRHLHRFARRPRPSTVMPIAPALDAIVTRAMSIDPDHRFESAGEMAARLLGVVRAQGESRPVEAAVAVLVRGPLERLGCVSRARRALEGRNFTAILDSPFSTLMVRLGPAGDDIEDCIPDGVTWWMREGKVETESERVVGGPLLDLETWS